MSKSDANNLTTGSNIFWRNLVNLKNYVATVSSVTKGNSITISVPSGGGSKTYALDGDVTAEIPISPLV